MKEAENIVFWVDGEDCCDPVWEAAYNRFESPEEEKRKFRTRLQALGVNSLPKRLRVADLFCGRGNNLSVLEEMGFEDIVGVDLSPALLRRYRGRAKLYVGDCRDIRLPDASRDVVIVQGGLHHLPSLPEDLEKCLSEIVRVLAPGGLVYFVEPCLTPFLALAHACCHVGPFRKLYPRLDALAVMIEHERETYHAWLSQMPKIREIACRHFDSVVNRSSMGKWYFVGKSPDGQ